ncbi:MAG: hypothetical protein HAW60_03475 [Bdellovibrionales bacterium]|nr:hypothetical protein [Bdellovibrionales bacterium]
MFKIVLILLVSFVGFKSWSGPAKSRRPKTSRPVKINRPSNKPLIPSKYDSKFTSNLAINTKLKLEAEKDMKEMESKINKLGPKLLIQKKNIFNESKQILEVLRGRTKDKENLELLVSLVSKQSLSMISTKSKTQVENFQFLLTSINSKLVSNNVLLKDVLKESTEDYVVARKKVSASKKEAEGSKFLSELRKRCNK